MGIHTDLNLCPTAKCHCISAEEDALLAKLNDKTLTELYESQLSTQLLRFCEYRFPTSRLTKFLFWFTGQPTSAWVAQCYQEADLARAELRQRFPINQIPK